MTDCALPSTSRGCAPASSRAADELHDSARLADRTWAALTKRYDDAQLIELLALAGWYRTISYVANGIGLDDEQWGIKLPSN